MVARSRDSGFHSSASYNALQAQYAHQPLHRAFRHLEPFTVELAPHFAYAVHPEVFFPHPTNFTAQHRIAFHTRR